MMTIWLVCSMAQAALLVGQFASIVRERRRLERAPGVQYVDATFVLRQFWTLFAVLVLGVIAQQALGAARCAS